MAIITIDGTEYDSDNFSEEAKKQLASLQFVKNEIVRLQAQLAVYKTAESGYANALKNELDT
tara:strand:+ start:985 stop:1170 length:186 start_codon:yes stop_codon:yes gene_type:complete